MGKAVAIDGQAGIGWSPPRERVGEVEWPLVVLMELLLGSGGAKRVYFSPDLSQGCRVIALPGSCWQHPPGPTAY